MAWNKEETRGNKLEQKERERELYDAADNINTDIHHYHVPIGIFLKPYLPLDV
jgi:hypothetical protein